MLLHYFLKYLKIRIPETKPIINKVLFEFGISLLISWAVLVSELIEGNIFDIFFQRITKPCIDEPSSSLDIVGFFARKCDKMNRVVSDIVDDTEPCYRLSIEKHHPLTNFTWIECSDTFVVGDIVTFEPVFYSCFAKCIHKTFPIDCSYFCS